MKHDCSNYMSCELMAPPIAAAFQVVNVGHDREISLKDLVALLMDLTGLQKKIVFDTTKPEGCLRKSADMTKLRQIIPGFEPQTDLREGLREMIAAFKSMLKL